MGADRVCFGSDFPHPEGLADPLSFVEQLEGHEPAEVERIMSTQHVRAARPRPAGAGR